MYYLPTAPTMDDREAIRQRMRRSFLLRLKQMRALQLDQHPDAIGLRLAVAPAACSGLRYRVE
ncbi:MAG TPA: hypothetical protein VFA81_09295, partial [Burkholderiales bacterium]|nr:hypothetical protein [Burkholderiales bacterium]